MAAYKNKFRGTKNIFIKFDKIKNEFYNSAYHCAGGVLP
jgi:hypothetical protein